jgi:hypothetical protein
MKSPLYRNLVACAMAVLAMGTEVSAQSPVDIGLYRNGNMLDVTVRPQADFGGIVSAVVFTIRWESGSNAVLGRLVQEGAAAEYLPIAKSGGIREVGSTNYQVYAGFGMTPMSGETWRAGQEYVIASIPFTGKGEFELVNDGWTREVKNNANYYLSLGGIDHTGVIYKGLASTDDDSNVSILPNPNNGQFTFMVEVGDKANVTVEVLSSLGQSIYTDVMNGFQGTYRRDMDLTSMSSGVYFLKVTRDEQSSVHKIVYNK